MTRQRLTAQQWRALVDQQRSSGMTIDAFCDQHDLAVSTFFVCNRFIKPVFPCGVLATMLMA